MSLIDNNILIYLLINGLFEISLKTNPLSKKKSEIKNQVFSLFSFSFCTIHEMQETNLQHVAIELCYFSDI